MKLRFLLTFCLLPLCVAALAANPKQVNRIGKNEIRLGVGDMFFETAIWHNQVHKDYDAVDGYIFTEDCNYKYTPHFSAEYSYHVLPWLSLGVMVDFQMTSWERSHFDGGNVTASVTRESFNNLSIMPTLRFNYFRREHVGLYSSISGGFDFNGGTEVDGFGRHTEIGVAADIRPIGVCVGHNHFWAFLELGGLHALRTTNCIYMLNSSIFRAGASYIF